MEEERQKFVEYITHLVMEDKMSADCGHSLIHVKFCEDCQKRIKEGNL